MGRVHRHDCCLHCTTGLLIVLAIPEPAIIHKVEHVDKCSLNAAPDNHRLTALNPGYRSTSHRQRAGVIVSPPSCADHADRACASEVAISWRPISEFTSVDLPTPEAPKNASVRPPSAAADGLKTDSGDSTAMCTGTPAATARSSSTVASMSSATSDFVSTICGCALNRTQARALARVVAD